MKLATNIIDALSAAVFTCILASAAACSSEVAPGEGADDQTSTKSCDVRTVSCEVMPPQCPTGQTASVRGGCYGPCIAVSQCTPGTFQCNQGPALCEVLPPRCAAGETLTTRNGCFGGCVPSNVCFGGGGSTPPSGGSANCDLSLVRCEVTTPRCPEGQTPTANANGCYGACVPLAECKAKSFNCDQGGPALCEIVPPRCASDERLTTRNGCFGPCVPSGICR